MKRITLALVMLFTLTTVAQSNSINYKALIKDANNTVVANTQVTVQFQILQGVAQTNVYQETHSPTTDANGIIIINIGEGTVDSGVYANIDWSSDDHFLNTQINLGSGLTNMGTTDFNAVPYALSAKTAENITETDPKVTSTTTNTVPKWDGTNLVDGSINDVDGDIAIGTATPDPSAQLDVSSTSKGFLPPRMTNSERSAIDSPAQGLIIYCTNCGSNGEPQYFNGINWLSFSGASASSGTPILSTESVTSISVDGAVSGGNVTDDDGEAVTARGVCWSLNPNPTIADSNTSDGIDIGAFSSTLTGLQPATMYYLRAYATNSVGTSYGNELSFTTGVLTIDSSYGGGRVAYILQAGDPGFDSNVQHGIIVSTSYITGAGAPWSLSGSTVVIGTSGTAIGTGQANTDAIILAYGNTGNYAAKACRDYNAGGFTDWYLPSIDELIKVYQNRSLLSVGFNNNGGSSYHWTSSESAGAFAQSLFWANGLINYFTTKTDGRFVRPVRSF